MTRLRCAISVLLGMTLTACEGCSTFGKDFAAATPQPRPGAIDGPWDGQWKSAGGHQGQLRCLLKETAAMKTDGAAPAPGGELQVSYEARFEAKFWGIFTAHYTVNLAGTWRDETATLSGDQDLGGLEGGRYHYTARVTPEKFDATYQSPADRGEFHMARPAAKHE